VPATVGRASEAHPAFRVSLINRKRLGGTGVLTCVSWKIYKPLQKPKFKIFVILSEAKNLFFSITSRFFTSFRMTEKKVWQ
jgi:hypothetical protein